MAKKIFVAEMALSINSLSGLLHRGNAWRLAPLLWGMLLRAADAPSLVGCVSPNSATITKAIITSSAASDAMSNRSPWSFCAGHERHLSRRAAPLRHRRHADQALRQARRGCWHPSQPDAWAGRQKYLYGHVWVTLAWVVRHASWVTIGLPCCRSCMCGVPTLRVFHRRTR